MKLRYLISLLLLILWQISNAQTPVKVMTFNIRCGYCEPPESENHWSNRKFLVAELIKKHQPDLIGFQEAELFQINDLKTLLPDYEGFGVGREDGVQKGETTSIFYRKTRFGLWESQTWWLSKTPSKVSTGWDAAYSRTLTCAKFWDLESKREFYFLNTHFDHLGEIARTKSSRLILNKIKKFNKELPIIVSGDFNFTNRSDGYKIITSYLNDTEKIADKIPVNLSFTFNGFGTVTDSEQKIDFILTKTGIEVLSYEVDNSQFDGCFPSDHFPVIVKLRF